MSDVYFDYLEHYGVKGMKWGIRKERPNTSNSLRIEIANELL